MRENASTLFAGGLPTAQKLTNPNNIQASIIELRRDAEAIREYMPDIAAYILELARADIESANRAHTLDPKKSYELGETKGEERTEYKIVCENGGDATKMRDVARDRLKANNIDEVGAICAVLEDLKQRQVELPHGARIIDFSNRFERPTDRLYSSGKANIAIPHPHDPERYVIYEDMLIHEGFERISESHDLYERIRIIEDIYANEALPPEVSEEFDALMQQVKVNHQRARDIHSLDHIDFDHWRQVRAQNARQAALLEGPDYVI